MSPPRLIWVRESVDVDYLGSSRATVDVELDEVESAGELADRQPVLTGIERA
jgi:hypothetical protein